MLLQDKRLVITGVLTDASLAFNVARIAQEEGAEVVLTSFGRAMRLTQRTARRLPRPPDVLELDVTNDEHFSALTNELQQRWDGVDGVLHSIGFAPEACLGGDFLRPAWSDVSVALQVSAYSLKSLAAATLPLMKQRGGSVVALDFDARQAWPDYNWMGVAKAALESTARYLARDLGRFGIRVNLVSSGPIYTMAARSFPLHNYERIYKNRCPLGWDANDPIPTARACAALLSDWFPATSGEIVHVDGGLHAIGTSFEE